MHGRCASLSPRVALAVVLVGAFGAARQLHAERPSAERFQEGFPAELNADFTVKFNTGPAALLVTVVDQRDASPIEQAEVALESVFGEASRLDSGVNGLYVFPLLFPGNYRLTVEADRYLPERRDISLGDTNYSVLIELQTFDVESLARLLATLFATIDMTGDGALSYLELLESGNPVTEEQFRELDRNRDGLLTLEELESWLKDDDCSCRKSGQDSIISFLSTLLLTGMTAVLLSVVEQWRNS